tara:strand:+ start:448 stop:828 length:381 start_codon:yes stop_codon:yes gene_type:complete
LSSFDSKTLKAVKGIACLLEQRRCENVLILNVSGLSQISDFLIIATGTSERQMRAVSSEVINSARDQGINLARQSVDSHGTWVVLDFIDFVAHLFEPNRRSYYDLESLWSDAPHLSFLKDNLQNES